MMLALVRPISITLLLASAILANTQAQTTPQPVGLEFQVNTHTNERQEKSVVASLSGGGYVVVWQSYDQDAGVGDWGIFAQIYDSSGVAIGSEFQLNTFTAGNQANPTVKGLSNGGFVFVYGTKEIWARTYDANGTTVDSWLQVNTYTSSNQRHPSVAALSNGGYVVAWESRNQDGDDYGVFAQRVDHLNNPVGSEFQVNTYTTLNQRDPSVATLNDGGFIVTWESQGQDGNDYGIYAQRYDAVGNPVDQEFLVNTTTSGSQKDPVVTGLADGGFIVVWDHGHILAQRYDASGNPDGIEFRINNTGATEGNPTILGLSDGGFLAVWQINIQAGTYGIYGQRYDQNGNQIGDEFQANTYTTSDQERPSIASSINGEAIITWDSEGQDGDRTGVFGQRFDVGGPLIPLAVGDSFNIQENEVTVLPPASLLDNDIGSGPDSLTLDSISNTVNSTVTIDGNGDIRIEPDVDHVGSASFDYTISDSAGGDSTGTVILDVTPGMGHNFVDTPIAIATGSDDAEELGTGNVYLTKSRNELGSGQGDIAGLRFILDIPVTEVEEAFIQFTAYSTKTNSINLNIHAEAADDAASFVNANNNVSSRPLTSTVVNWSPAGWNNNDSGDDQRTPDLSALVNEVIQRTGWVQGNHIVFIVSGSPHGRNADAFEEGSGIPILHLKTNEYEPPSDVQQVNIPTNGIAGNLSFDWQRPATGAVSYYRIRQIHDSVTTEYTVTYANTQYDLTGLANGDYTFEVQACNAQEECSPYSTPANVTMTPTVPPVANNDTPAAIPEGGSATMDLVANDTDVDDAIDFMSISIITAPVNGNITSINTDGTVDYTHDGSETATDSFTYTIKDVGGGESNIATVSFTVTPVNDVPIATTDTDSTVEDTVLVIDVLANDTDDDGDTLSVSAVTQGINGAVTNNGTNVTYTPDANYYGNDTFTYDVDDGNGGSDSATVNITITSVNDVPVAVADSGNTTEDVPVSIFVLTNDSDIEGDSLTVSGVSQGANGSVTYTTTDTTYTPNPNFYGNDSFSYTASDGNGGQAVANVSITISPVNDAPSLDVNLPLIVDEGTSATITDLLATDPDDISADLTYTVTVSPIHGQLENVANPGVAITGFTQADIDNGNVMFVHDGSEALPGEMIYPYEMMLSDLVIAEGITLDGLESMTPRSTYMTAAGDINKDSVADVIMGAPMADGGGIVDAGETYVVFGQAGGLTSNVDANNLDGINGFVIRGVNTSDQSGFSVSWAGDINGDEIDDIVIGAPFANAGTGAAYIVFGSLGGFSSVLDLTLLDGTNGFVINGITAGDQTGYSVTPIADVNRDGINDLLISAPYADPNGVNDAGEVYVVFGSDDNFAASLDLVSLDGINGTLIQGAVENARIGLAIADVGDINNDGISDFSISANGSGNSVQGNVIFGEAGLHIPDAFGFDVADGGEDGAIPASGTFVITIDMGSQ